MSALAWVLAAGLKALGWLRGFLASGPGKIIGAVALAVLVTWAAYQAGSAKGTAKAEAKCKEQAQRALVTAQERYRTEEAFHAREIQELQTKFSREREQAASVDAAAMADLRSGVRRLRFPVAARCPAAAPPAASTGRVDGPAAADIAPATAEALYSIAADGDQAIRQLTALQAWARDALKLCGQQEVR